VLAVLFGVLAFVWPVLTWLTLIVMFGIYAISDGLIAVITGLRRSKDSSRWWAFLVEGVLGIGAGSIALILPELAALVLIYMIAIWALITGILEIAAAVRLRDEISNEWVLGLSGFVSMVLGILLFVQPAVGGLAIMWTIAGYALVFGVLWVILGFRLRGWQTPDRRTTIPSA
jgi:uncharacterized membrane protein HdeD (DUF308 family)